MLAIELTEPKIDQCECCGGVTTTLVRFVHKDDTAHAVYYAAFAENHPDRGVSAVVSIGPWGDDATPEERSVFALRLWDDSNNFHVSVIDVSDSPWPDKPFLGSPLTRSEALEHPLLPDVFHITDHMFRDDEPLISFLRRSRPARKGRGHG